MKTEEVREYLQKRISGDVLWDRDILRFYSVDASSYQVIPEVVIIPKNERDVINTVKFAKKFQRSVTARGAGTGLVGNSLNDGIILDMRSFDSIKIKKKFVIVGSGTNKGRLDEKLKERGKFFPPNPSVGRYCTIGGMLGNNSSGSKSLKYGSTVDNVLEVTFVDGNGNKITLPQNSRVRRKVLALTKQINRNKLPDVTKNSSGYRIDHVSSVNDTQKVVVGSEGTLGIITSARLRIRDIPEKRALYIIEYDSLKSAAEDCAGMLKTKPSAVEFVDTQTLKNLKLNFNRDTKCLLFVEYDSNLTKADKMVKRAATGSIKKRVLSEEEIQKWWRLRDLSLYYSLKSVKPKDRVPHIIEDATVPVKKLACLFKVIEDLNRKFKTDAVTYGHAGNGNIHVRLLANRQDPEKIKKIAEYYFKRVMGMGGSLSGEHGDGLARTGFVKAQYGPENYKIFKQLKKILDPHNILNPGKIISQKNTMIQNLEKLS